MSDDPDSAYVYPGTKTLRNKFDIRSARDLDRIERLLVTQRARAGIPTGDFDLAHLQAIHRHLFQDVYEWAGQIRTVVLEKEGNKFHPPGRIEFGMLDVHKRIVAANYFKGLSQSDFAARAGAIIGDVNYAHPFREGNGRTQLQYLKQLAERAGHSLDLTRIQRAEWLQASREAHNARYNAMARSIEAALVERQRTPRDYWSKEPTKEKPATPTRERGQDEPERER